MDVTVTGFYPPGTITADRADVIAADLAGQHATVELTPDHDAVTVTITAVGIREAMWVAGIAITGAVKHALAIDHGPRHACEPHRVTAERVDAAA